MVDALHGEGVRQLCVVLRAAADAAVFESPAHSSGFGEEPTARHRHFRELCGQQLHRDSRLTPTDLIEHWAEWSGGYRAEHITSCHMIRDPRYQ